MTTTDVTTTELDRVELLKDELGVGVTIDYEYRGKGEARKKYDLPEKIKGVNPRFTPQQWVSLAQREGASYVGGCCGNMSLLQDYINGAFRGGGYFESDELIRIAELARSHDGFDEFDPMDDEQFVKKVDSIRNVKEKIESGELEGRMVDPWSMLGVIHNAVEPFLTPTSTTVPKAKLPWETDEKRLVGVLADTLTRMDWADFFRDQDGNEAEQASHLANAELLRAKVLPPMRKLVSLIEETGVGFEGFAIINPETQEVLANRSGLCVYKERAQAEQIVEQWARWAEEESKRHEDAIKRAKERGEDPPEKEIFWQARKSKIVPATITVEEGLKLTTE